MVSGFRSSAASRETMQGSLRRCSAINLCQSSSAAVSRVNDCFSTAPSNKSLWHHQVTNVFCPLFTFFSPSSCRVESVVVVMLSFPPKSSSRLKKKVS